MISTKLLRCSPAVLRPASRISPIARPTSQSNVRHIASSSKLYKDDKKESRTAEKALDKQDGHQGAFSRTDNTVQIEHPTESDYPQSEPVPGRGGIHFKRTLPSFSLEGGVAVVTGGARGLGLVMSQACMLSGANVALVDLNSMYGWESRLTSEWKADMDVSR